MERVHVSAHCVAFRMPKQVVMYWGIYNGANSYRDME